MIVAAIPTSSPPPAPLRLTVDALVDEHRHRWIADAAAYLRLLDWQWLNGRQLAIVDFEDVPDMPSPGCVAFTSPVGVFELLRPFLRYSPLPAGPGLLIGTREIAAVMLGGGAIDRLSEGEAVWHVRAAITAVAMHEYAHAIDFEVRGITLPPHHSIASIAASSTTPVGTRRNHSPTWIRAYAHLIHRSRAMPAHRPHYDAEFEGSVELHRLGAADEILRAVKPEVDRVGLDAPLVEVLREPASPDFLDLFTEWDAALPAVQET